MTISSNKTIFKNTMMLYVRQILILFISLYTVRNVLDILGVEDYGIYNVVAGIVTFFSFLSGTMAMASQRFFSIAIGQGDNELLNKTFSINILIYLAISIVAFVLLETVGLWFVNKWLNLPPERFEAALLVYHISVATFMASILSTPFMAIIIAHEDMQIYAYVSIVEAFLKLTVLFLLYYLKFDKLVLYASLIFLTAFNTTAIYIFISFRKYEECQFRKLYWDQHLMFEIMGFTSWTLFGQLTTIGRNQGITILLNQFFNPVVVASRAIAINISTQIGVFSNNFNLGLYPPIIKAYAADNKKQMFSLIFNGSKITFFLMWIFSLPLILEMDTILKLWLKNPPLESVLFARLALIEVLINSISMPLTTAARAPGKMMSYELILGTIQIAIFAFSLIALLLGGKAYIVFVVAIVANILMFLIRLVIVRRLIDLSLLDYINQVFFPVLLVTLVSAVSSYAVHFFLSSGLFFTALSMFSSVIITSSTMYFLGLDLQMRLKVKSKILLKFNALKKKITL